MEITYLGHSSFRIKGKNATLITDPFDSDEVGLKFPKHAEADIVTVSHDHADHNKISSVEGTPFIVKGPGEYEIKGVGIVGISSFHDDEKGEKRGRNTMYRIEMDKINIVHLGDLGHNLSSAQVDELDGIDILMIPVGGIYTIDAAKAAQVISDLEPSVVIPMHYKRDGLTSAYDGMTGTDELMKELGKEGITAVPKLSITKDKIPAEMQLVILE